MEDILHKAEIHTSSVDKYTNTKSNLGIVWTEVNGSTDVLLGCLPTTKLE